MDNVSTGSPSRGPSRFAERVESYRTRVNVELERWLTAEHVASSRLLKAMRYAVLSGGKRIRPLLAYASGELLDVVPERIDAIAAAIEMIHAYSLVHDDLPAMDDDDLRRGRATVHVAFDEATAILVGDGLQALAVQVLAEHESLVDQPMMRVLLMQHLARSAGPDGMVGGQALDLAYSGRTVSAPSLEDMFARKTGRLIGAAIEMPSACAHRLDPRQGKALRGLARTAGICFQIRDDVLDVIASTEQLGKRRGSDRRNDRSSYPSRFGLDAAMRRADSLFEEAKRCLDGLGPRADGLRWITHYLVERER